MKNKGSNPDKIKSESQLVMRGLCSEPSFDSFCSILIEVSKTMQSMILRVGMNYCNDTTKI